VTPRPRVAGPLLLGHRGASADYPENTLAAFAAALDAGAGGVELDVRLSRDGVPVVIHDAGLARTTGVPGLVAERTRAELAGLDAGAWRGRPGEPVPTLEEALTVVAGRGVTAIELKETAAVHPGLAVTVLEVAERAGVLGSVLILAFDHAHLPAARRRAPEVPTVALTADRPADPAELLAATGAALIGPPAGGVDAWLCDAVHAAGGQVLAWTVDDPVRFDELLAAGCDVLVSNRPALMADRLRRWSAAPGPAPGRAAGRPSAGR